jgi:hypothetical protein
LGFSSGKNPPLGICREYDWESTTIDFPIDSPIDSPVDSTMIGKRLGIGESRGNRGMGIQHDWGKSRLRQSNMAGGRFIVGKIIEPNGGFSIAMFEYRRVTIKQDLFTKNGGLTVAKWGFNQPFWGIRIFISCFWSVSHSSSKEACDDHWQHSLALLRDMRNPNSFLVSGDAPQAGDAPLIWFIALLITKPSAYFF